MNLFSYYSYLTKLGWNVLDVLPPPVRNTVFSIAFSHMGRGGNIDYGCYFRCMKKIRIGDNVWINRGCKFFASYHIKEAKIEIGNNVSFGPNVTIFGAGHDYSRLPMTDTAETVTICDDVWVGGNSTIIQGVTIGKGAVVAAGSVVSKDVEPWTVVAGIPAKKIKERKVEESRQ